MTPTRNVCCTALAAVGALTAVFGLCFVFFYDSAVFASSRNGVNHAFWSHPVTDPALRHYQHWIHAVLGSTMVGWGITIAAVAHVPLRRGERWAWWALAAAVVAWSAFDTAASLRFGVGHNVLVNAVATIALLAPLLPLWPREPDVRARAGTSGRNLSR